MVEIHEAPVVCAWCSREMRAGDSSLGVSHGICVHCLGRERGLEDLTRLTQEELEALPFGVIQLDGRGTVTAYNQTEAGFSRLEPARVLGKNFFRDIAPCTQVKEIAGAVNEFRRAKRNGGKRLSFVFTFAHGAMWMSIALTYRADTDTTTLLVRPLATETTPAEEKKG